MVGDVRPRLRSHLVLLLDLFEFYDVKRIKEPIKDFFDNGDFQNKRKCARMVFLEFLRHVIDEVIKTGNIFLSSRGNVNILLELFNNKGEYQDPTIVGFNKAYVLTINVKGDHRRYALNPKVNNAVNDRINSGAPLLFKVRSQREYHLYIFDRFPKISKKTIINILDYGFKKMSFFLRFNCSLFFNGVVTFARYTEYGEDHLIDIKQQKLNKMMAKFHAGGCYCLPKGIFYMALKGKILEQFKEQEGDDLIIMEPAILYKTLEYAKVACQGAEYYLVKLDNITNNKIVRPISYLELEAKNIIKL